MAFSMWSIASPCSHWGLNKITSESLTDRTLCLGGDRPAARHRSAGRSDRVLDRDRILERGCHHELLAAGGRSAGASSSTLMGEIPRSGGIDPRQPISRAASTAAREEL